MAGLEQKEYQEGITPIDFSKLKDTSSRVNEFDRQLKHLPNSIDDDGNQVNDKLSGLEFNNNFPLKLSYTIDNTLDVGPKGRKEYQKITMLYDDHKMGYFTREFSDKNNDKFVDDFMSFHTQILSTYGSLKLDNSKHEKLIYEGVGHILTPKDIQEYHRRNALNTPEPKDLKDTKKGIDQDTKDLKKTNKEYLKLNTSNVNHIGQLLAEKISRTNDVHSILIKRSLDEYNAKLAEIEQKALEPGFNQAIKADLERQMTSLELGLQNDAAKYLIKVADINPHLNDQKIAENLCKLLPALYNYNFEPSRIKGFFKDLATMKSGGKIVIKNGFTEDGTPERVIEEYFNIIFAEKHLYGQGAPGVVEGDRGWFRKNKLIADGRGKGSGQVLTPGATGATRNVYREGTAKLDTSPAGTEAQSYIKTHIRYKTVGDTKQEHIITDIDLTKTPMEVLIDLYHEYNSGDHAEYSRRDLQMIQYYIVKNVITGVAQNSGPATFAQLGNGDMEQGKVIFKQCMMNTIFSKDRPLSQGLIHEINNEAYKRSAGMRATGTDAYGVSGTALDDAGNYIRGYGPGATSSVNFDEIVWRSAAYGMARHFGAGTIALEVVFNPKNGVYGSDTEAADIFREIAATTGIKHELGKDRSGDGLANTGLRGGLDIAVGKMTEAGMSKNLAEGIANGVEIAANVAEAGMTIAAVFKGAQAGFNVLKGSWNFLFGEGDKYKADFDAAWTRAKSAMGYATGSAAIGFIKDPANYLQKNVLVQAIGPMLSDTVKRQQIDRKMLEDGKLRQVADTFTKLTEEMFAGYSVKQLVEAGVISKGTNGIVVNPTKLEQFFAPTISSAFRQKTPQQQQEFLRDSAKAIERSLVNSYGLDNATFDQIKDSNEDIVNLLKARRLRTIQLDNALTSLRGIPGLNINKEELLKLDDAALEERIARFEAIKTLYTKLSPAGYDAWGNSTGKDFVAKFAYTYFQRDILGSADRPGGVGSQPRSFKQYRQDKLVELADALDKVTADDIFAAMMNVLANVSAARDKPSVPPSVPAASGTVIAPSTTPDEPNYRNSGSAPSMYEYMTFNIPALTVPLKNACKTGKKDLIPNTNTTNFEWKKLEN